MYRFLYHPGVWAVPSSIGICLLRVTMGLTMALGHGWPLIERLSDSPVDFPDPLGLGAEISLAATVATEFLCALAVSIGFVTRWAAAPIAFTMFVAAFVVEASSPWEWKESAVVFGSAFLALSFTGPGRFSIDAYLFETARWEDRPAYRDRPPRPKPNRKPADPAERPTTKTRAKKTAKTAKTAKKAAKKSTTKTKRARASKTATKDSKSPPSD